MADPGPELRLGDTPNLCSLGWRPSLMTGMLLQHFRAHFAEGAAVEDPALRGTVWRPGPDTGIAIEDVRLWGPSLAHLRPAIVVKRNDVHPERRGIDDRRTGYLAGDDGSEYYDAFLVGSHTLFAVADEPGVVDRLADEVYRELLQFGPVLREKFLLHRLVLAGIGAAFRVEEAPDSHAVPVTVAWAYEESWRIVQQAPLLRRVVLGDETSFPP